MLQKERTFEELLEISKARTGDRKRYMGKKRRARQELPQTAGEILPAVFEDNPSALRRLEENRAMMAWEKYVGECAASRSAPARFRGSQLVVVVQDPLWMQQLVLLKHGLLQRYKRDFPRLKITDIFFTRKLK